MAVKTIKRGIEMAGLTREPPNGRGCGQRTAGAGYACCGLSPWGRPIEDFVVDPQRPFKWQRGMEVLPRDPGKPEGIHDLIICIGEKPKKNTEGYKSPWCFLEEARLFGPSRKLGQNTPIELLTPYKSRMIFVHRKAIPLFEYKLDRPNKPLYGCRRFQDWVDNRDVWDALEVKAGYHPLSSRWGHAMEGNQIFLDCFWYTQETEPCTFALRDLSLLLHPEVEVADNGIFTVKMPSFSYQGRKPEVEGKIKWASGVFLALPLQHIEFPKRANKKMEKRCQEAGFETVVMDY